VTKFDPSQRLRIDGEERYAQERAYGYRPHEAARRAGLNPRHGISSKYEVKSRVVARIAFLRRDDLTTEMREEKRRRIEDRLEAAAYGDIVRECATFDEETGELIKIDWRKVIASGLSVAINEFGFDKDTGRLVRFKRDDALNAVAQLRDMRGFKAVEKRDVTVHSAVEQMSDDELARIAAGGVEGSGAVV
jgi:hypothetical protein